MATETGFGSRMRELREARGYSQEAFAHSVGLTSAVVGRLERNATDPMRTTVGVVMAIAHGLGVSMYELLGIDPPGGDG